MNLTKILRTLIPALCAGLLVTGCSLPFAKKKVEVPRDPVYGEDAEYTKKVDNYLASADETVKTPYGNIAIMTLPSTTHEISVSHNSSPKVLREAAYLMDQTDNSKNTEGRFITHFSYTKDMSDPELMSVAMVLQSADVPQSIFMDSRNAIHKYYTAEMVNAISGSSITVSYPNNITESVGLYKVNENGKKISKKSGEDRAFAYVYIIPYNEGYVMMETYAPEDRGETSIFGKVTEKAKSNIGDNEIISQLRKYIDKNRKKLISDDERATIDECKARSEEILGAITLADYNEDARQQREQALQDTAAQDVSLCLQYIPDYKAESTLEKPEYEDFSARMQANGYKEKENRKAEKPKHILYHIDYTSIYDSGTKGSLIKSDFNKNAANEYKKIKKVKSSKDGYESTEIIGRNFRISYGYNTEKDRMWAVYLFKNREDFSKSKEFYKIDYETKKKVQNISINAETPELITFSGNIKDVISTMKLIKFTKADYKDQD
ncbi:MAG: hypothetical protein ACI4CS_07110 [Candidatus Weimeria sp.]